MAATNGHLGAEGSAKRVKLRDQIFYDNAWAHWQAAVREPQRPRATRCKISTAKALVNKGQGKT